MKFNVRNLTKNDYEILVEWWDWWPGWVAPPKTFLPETGLMVTKDNKNIAACYYYLTNSKAAFIPKLDTVIFTKLCVLCLQSPVLISREYS